MSGLYQVERIVARRKSEKNQFEYKVKWVGYPESQCTWEPTKNLRTVIEMVEQFDMKFDRKGEESKLEHKDSKEAKDINELKVQKEQKQKEQKERERMLRQKQFKEAKQRKEARELRERKEAEEMQRKNKQLVHQEDHKKENVSVEKKQTRNGVRNISKPISLDQSEELPKTRTSKRSIREIDQQGLIPTKRAKPEETEDESQQISNDKMQSLIQKILEASGKSENEKVIKILEISKNSDGELIYLTDENGLKNYKSRPYMLKNHAQSMIDFYESKIQFVRTSPMDITH